MPFRILLAWLLLSASQPLNSAAAATISLETQAQVTAEGPSLRLSIKLTNKGDESAFSVAPEIAGEGYAEILPKKEKLKPGETYEFTKELTVPGQQPGAYVLLLTTHYTDAGQYPFSVITPIPYVIESKKSPQLAALLKSTTLSEQGQMTLLLRNLRKEPLTVKGKLPLPKELSCANTAFEARLAPSGTETLVFDLHNKGGTENSLYAVFAVLDYEAEGFHHSDIANAVVKIVRHNIPRGISAYWVPGFLLCLAFFFRRRKKSAAAVLILFSILAFILTYFRPEYLFSDTTITGGDMASHVYPAKYLKDYLLPHFKISGWSQAHYGGYPLFLFYFPLPFLLIAGLSCLLPFALAFKLVTVLGVFLLPLAAYASLRALNYEFPIPLTGAIFTLPFLFNEGNSMWGGNIPSVLAGEFAYQLGLLLFLLFWGSLYRGIEQEKHAVRNAWLLAGLGLTHGYTFVFAVALAPFFILSCPRGAVAKRLSYLATVYGLGTGLMSFWFIPMFTNQKWTIPFKWTWSFTFSETFPLSLVFFLPLAAAIKLRAAQSPLQPVNQRWDNRALYLGYSILTGIILFCFAYRLEVVDIRLLPFIQLFLMFMAAAGLWNVFRFLKNKIFWVFIVAALGMTWTAAQVRFIPDWIDWNYSGFEQKKDWPLFEEINQSLKGTFADPRIAVEPSADHEKFGTMRAFESLPLFSGRQTLEGLYMQSSISSPFVFYQQGEMSASPPCPYADYLCPDFNLTGAIAHLKLFNVKDVVVRSEKAQKAFSQTSEARLEKKLGDIEIYELVGNENRYAGPVKYQPVIFETDNWKRLSYAWFRNPDLAEVPLILNATAQDINGILKNLSRAASLDNLPKIPVSGNPAMEETIKNEEIILKNTRPGKPVLIKISYHPNWRVEGARKIFLVSPSFMLIYPETENVRLYFGNDPNHGLGWLITLAALAGIFILKFRHQHFPLLFPGLTTLITQYELPIKSAAGLFYAGLLLGGLLDYSHTPLQIYNRANRLYENRQYAAASSAFQKFLARYPDYSLSDDAAMFNAMGFYQNQDYAQAAAAFEFFTRHYPDSPMAAEALYHHGLALLENGNQQAAMLPFNQVLSRFPNSVWADYSKDRLKKLEQV